MTGKNEERFTIRITEDDPIMQFPKGKRSQVARELMIIGWQKRQENILSEALIEDNRRQAKMIAELTERQQDFVSCLNAQTDMLQRLEAGIVKQTREIAGLIQAVNQAIKDDSNTSMVDKLMLDIIPRLERIEKLLNAQPYKQEINQPANTAVRSIDINDYLSAFDGKEEL